jgi:uroporphyrinogen-III synthase
VKPGQPLAGKRILVTRARHQAGQLSAQLDALGAEVIEIPAIEIQPPESFEPLDAALRSLARYQWLIVTSANTVRSLRERMGVLGLSVAAFSHLQIAAVGSATAHALADAGFHISLVPREYVAESLLSKLGDRISGERVLLARAALARDVIPEALTARGAKVDVVDAYRTVVPASSAEHIAKLFSSDERPPDAATFTSSSTVTNFFHLLASAGIEQPPSAMKAISIGPITSQTLRDHKWEPAAEADPHDLSGLIAAVVQAVR